jgi:hypothetical protein
VMRACAADQRRGQARPISDEGRLVQSA